jgi:hypothetical protein
LPFDKLRKKQHGCPLNQENILMPFQKADPD